jgi:ferredoxin
VDEFYHKARAFGIPAFAAGDAQEIAEASAAIFSGRIAALDVARALGHDVAPTPPGWYRALDMLKSRPGSTVPERLPAVTEGVVPVLHCTQEIPCDPCAAVCPQGLIHIPEDDLRRVPTFTGGSSKACVGCERCVAACPGLAIALVDYRQDGRHPVVTVPYEFLPSRVLVGDAVPVVDTEGQVLGQCEVIGVRARANGSTTLVKVRAPAAYARHIAGIQVQEPRVTAASERVVERTADDAIVCRCERVTAGQVRALVQQGVRDINEIKALTRAGMGACGGKTCVPLIHRIFREEGIPATEVVDHVRRPLFIEVPLKAFVQT